MSPKNNRSNLRNCPASDMNGKVTERNVGKNVCPPMSKVGLWIKSPIQLDVRSDSFKASCEEKLKSIIFEIELHNNPSKLADVYIQEAFSPPWQSYINRRSNHRVTHPFRGFMQSITSSEYIRAEIAVKEFTVAERSEEGRIVDSRNWSGHLPAF